jgi:hypothetical protein
MIIPSGHLSNKKSILEEKSERRKVLVAELDLDCGWFWYV